jgi:hypothetical protein
VEHNQAPAESRHYDRYFNLHITIDNIDNGHADKAIKVIENIYDKYRDKE